MDYNFNMEMNKVLNNFVQSVFESAAQNKRVNMDKEAAKVTVDLLGALLKSNVLSPQGRVEIEHGTEVAKKVIDG